MNFKYKTLAIVVAATVSMTGCLSDPYDYDGGDGGGQGGGGGGVTDNKLSWGVHLYLDDKPEHYKESPYDIQIVDSTGDTRSVDGNLIELDNISIESEDFANFAPLKVTTSEKRAALQFSATKGYDLDVTYNGNSSDEQLKRGTLQFMIKPSTTASSMAMPQQDDKVLLIMASGDAKGIVDITSAVNASKGLDNAQHIKIPMQCFEDAGVDLTNVDMALSLETIGAIQYEFSDARLIANSLSPNWASNNFLACNNFSQVESGDVSVISRRYDGNVGNHGWANSPRANGGNLNWGNPSASAWPYPERFTSIVYEACGTGSSCYKPGSNSFFVFDIDLESNDDKPRIDLSEYMETGAVEFALLIPGNGQKPKHEQFDINFKFDASVGDHEENPQGSIPNSRDIAIDMSDYPGGLAIYRVSIPMQELFTFTDDKEHARFGEVRFNALQRIDKFASFVTTDEEGEADFTNFRYGLADIAIVKEPTQTEQRVQIYPAQ